MSNFYLKFKFFKYFLYHAINSNIGAIDDNEVCELKFSEDKLFLTINNCESYVLSDTNFYEDISFINKATELVNILKVISPYSSFKFSDNRIQIGFYKTIAFNKILCVVGIFDESTAVSCSLDFNENDIDKLVTVLIDYYINNDTPSIDNGVICLTNEQYTALKLNNISVDTDKIRLGIITDAPVAYFSDSPLVTDEQAMEASISDEPAIEAYTASETNTLGMPSLV